jgi:hypothetical protein
MENPEDFDPPSTCFSYNVKIICRVKELDFIVDSEAKRNGSREICG